MFRFLIAYFSVKKNSYNNEIVSNVRKTCCLRRLVSILGQFQVLLVVKLSKIGENPKNFRKIFVFEANKTAKAKIFSKIFISLKEHSIAENLAATWIGLGLKGF